MATTTIIPEITPTISGGSTWVKLSGGSSSAANRVIAVQAPAEGDRLTGSGTSPASITFPLTTISPAVESVSNIHVALNYTIDGLEATDTTTLSIEIASGESDTVGAATAGNEVTSTPYTHNFVVDWDATELAAAYFKIINTNPASDGGVGVYALVITVTYVAVAAGGGTAQAIFSGSSFGFGF